ncbi:multicopper oxidase [Nostoc linckia z18]|uniref:Multicopper oxidase n=2 Tax=Nostoc linckia TaxID=92942 RepID=A0A9Q5ZBV0_NOSLI|nr:copper oxidase [Nostoc linckia]PHK41397.1 multicopper oxidase [Nostoc linckia z15]PHK45933.1 multicopper oxidase [Nostoc linckia z16]PHJ60886.1 multicopper oxidase [Nostoc linckia z3]PHJ67217.1 multicopper oxidase [Nostoc linckia z1]PHJ76749.1 multicopper oxidase [Nostoc linckia z2]
MKTHRNIDMNSSAADSHAGMVMKPKATRSQLLAVTLLTLLALAFGVFIAALYGNFTMSARNMQPESMPGMNMGNQSMPGMNMNNDNESMPGMNMGGAKSPTPISSLPPAPMSSVTQMNGLVMPPGMIMTSDMSMEAMEDMAAVDLTKIAYTAPIDARGDRTLTPKLENGVKVFNLDVSLIKWNILPNVQVAAYAFNNQVPGPRIRVTEGDRVRIVVKNNLPESTTVHWHGMIVPNNMDGPADVTQKPILPGASYVYEFTVKQAGTYFYHSHKDVDRQQTLGMYGALIIDPKNKPETPAYDQDFVVQLQEWTVKQGYTFPAMPMEGLMPNFFTINGKAYPSTETINAKIGQKIRFRFIGSNNAFIHPMHIHGGPFKIIETDGNLLPATAQIEKDTINVAPGERYDVIWTARDQGKWLLHCHIAHHATNDNVEVEGGGGLTMIINVT